MGLLNSDLVRAAAAFGLALGLGLGLAVVAVLPSSAHAATADVVQETALNECPPVALDVSPPSTPTSFHFTFAQPWELRWNPSTDDTGVVAYELFLFGLTITTTNTSYPLSGPPVPASGLYAVRAVDAAGNVSPFAVARVGAGDTVPPTAPTNLRLGGPIEGHLTVRWDASQDDIFVAGYEVSLNDVLISRVGGTSAFVPYHGYGTYLVDVRAFDSQGRYSPTTRIGLAIDPPPTTPPATR